MKRKFAISDIHGQLEPLEALLKESRFDPEQDTLVVCGDLIDRGPQSAGVVRRIKQLQERYPGNVFATIGNHEIMMRRYVFEGKSYMWMNYGGVEVIKEFNSEFDTTDERNDHLVWLANLPLYVMDNEYFFTHSGIDPIYPLNSQDENVTFMELEQLYSYPKEDLNKRIGNRLLVHGHTPFSTVYRKGRFVSCDTGASVLKNGKLSLVDLSNNFYYACDTKTLHITKNDIMVLSGT